MQTTFERAEEARRLLADEGLLSVLSDIQRDAAEVFLRPQSSLEEIATAHEMVRAVDVLRTALQARITDETIERKRDQHRG